MYIDPRHLNPAQEPTPAMLHREEYLSAKRAEANARKSVKLPMAPSVDVRLMRAQIAARMGRLFGVA